MTLSAHSTLAEVAATVSQTLEQAGIAAALTGGACATLYSDGAYLSSDLDFILRGATTQRTLDSAMRSIGFTRDGDRYMHPHTPFYVEFTAGPLAIGQDLEIKPVRIEHPDGTMLGLSPTDSCRDRLTAFYHWSDRQSLETAIQIAIRHEIDLRLIERWSRNEGFPQRFQEFADELARRR